MIAPPSAAGRRAQRLRPQRLTAPDGAVAVALVDPEESPLAWLHSRRDRDGRPLIDTAEFAAGERLRRDYTLAGLLQRTTMNWSALAGANDRGGGPAAPAADAAIDARRRVQAALSAVGPEFSSLLVDVCCHLRGLGDVEAANGWPLRSGKVVLRLALSALARHYGLAAQAEGKAQAPQRHWGTDDYRPAL